MDKKSYLKWFPAAAVFPLLAAAWLLWGIGEARREAETMWLVTGEVWDREISSKELETMGEFPGLKQLWTVVRREAVLSLEGFQTETELNGVELESYPLEITRSGGKKYRGEKPLLVAGEDVFSALLDEQGKPCNERQRETFLQTLGKLEAEIILTDAGGEEDVLAGEEDPESMPIWPETLWKRQDIQRRSKGSPPVDGSGKICYK